MQADDAQNIVTDAGMDSQISLDYSSDYEYGVIFKQSAGGTVFKYIPIVLSQSLGPNENLTTVPDVVGNHISDGAIALVACEMTKFTIHPESESQQQVEYISAQSIPAGLRVSKDSKVQLDVKTNGEDISFYYNGELITVSGSEDSELDLSMIKEQMGGIESEVTDEISGLDLNRPENFGMTEEEWQLFYANNHHSTDEDNRWENLWFPTINEEMMTENPDSCYGKNVDAWAALVRAEAPQLAIWNGESGATSDPHFSASISSAKWNTELTQAKWDARRLVADLGHGFESLVFTMYDPCYDYPERYCRQIPPYWIRTRTDRFLKRMGLVKCNDRLEVTKVKAAYYTVQNVATLFDASVEPSKFAVRTVGDDKVAGLVTYTFRQKGTSVPILAFWDASRHPVNDNAVRRCTLETRGARMDEPVWVDLVTGAIYEMPKRMVVRLKDWGMMFEDIPFYDAPAVVTDRKLVMK